MKILKVILTVVVLVAGTIGIVGAALPAEHSVTRTIVVPASQDHVFALISHVQDYPHWRTGVDRVDVLPEENGQFHWVEDTTMGKIPQLLTENEPLSRRVVTIADPGLPWGGSWTFELAPQGLTTQLTITEKGYVNNVFLRFMNTYVIGQSSSIDQFENDLVKAVS